MLIRDVVREYIPDADDDYIEYIVWSQTGYPCFWLIPEDGNNPEECFRQQLSEFRDSMNIRQYLREMDIDALCQCKP